MRKLRPVTPGELLLEEFLRPMGISRYRLAREISVPPTRIADIVAGKRAVTADTDLRLCRFFGLSNGYWLRAQAAYDTCISEPLMGRSPTIVLDLEVAQIRRNVRPRNRSFRSRARRESDIKTER